MLEIRIPRISCWSQLHRITKLIAFATVLSALVIFQGASFSLPRGDVDEFPGKLPEEPLAEVVRQSVAEPQGGSVGRTFIFVPAGYNIHDRPPSINNETATKVSCSVEIMKVMDVNEVNEEISLELTLGYSWTDSRLRHLGRGRSESEFHLLNPSVMKHIWLPDLFFDGVKKISQPALITKPMSLKVNSRGELMHEGRWTATLACQMHFQYYPADTQKCFIDLRSYAHDHKQLQLVWSDVSAVTLQESFKLPNFDVTLDSKHDWHAKGRVPIIRFTISLRRKMSYHVIQTYLPSSLFVFISWLSFLIPSGSTPERLGCCMTTLLTLTAMFSAVRHNAPNVSYVKALDIWMLACIISVFLTLLVHVIICKLRSMRSHKTLGRSLNSDVGSVYLKIPLAEDPEGVVIDTQLGTRKTGSEADTEPCLSTNGNSSASERHLMETESEIGLLHPCKGCAVRLEFCASIIVPALFVLFNLLYWPVLMSKSEYNRKLYSQQEKGWLEVLVGKILPEVED